MSGSASDVAALSFAIDSSPVVTAAQALDQLRSSSDQVTDAHDRLIERSQRYIAVARDMGESIAQMRRQFTDTAQSIDGMLDSLDAARTKLDGTRESFAVLSDATGHVQALGEQFGVGAAGIEAFSSQAALLGLSAGQTTLALQRITEALQNQTLAGQQVRAQIQGLGVDLAGLTSNDAGSVLGTVVSRLRGTADGIGKYQTESSILGVTDPNTLYGINNQDYIPVETRRQINLAQRAQRQTSATYGQVARDERGYAQDDAEYQHLSGYYNLGRYGNVFSGLNSNQRSGLAGTLGLPSDTQFTSEDDRLSAFRYFQQNPDSEYASAARRPLARIERYVQNSGVGRAYNHLFDGTFGSNEADIQDQYDRESRATGYFGGIGAFGRAQGREIGNLFNLYTPQPVREDNRPVDADTALRNAEATAQTLGQFGDRSLTDYQATSATLRRLQDPSTLGTFVGADGTVEGQARYGNALSRLRNQQVIDQTPGGADLDEARQQGYLLSQPENQHGELQALIRFMSQNNVGNPRALYSGASPITLSEALNTDGTSGGPGFLTQDDGKRFLAMYRQQAANAAQQVLQEIDRQNAGARRVLGATSGAGLDESDIAGARFGASVANSYLALSPLERGGLSLDQYRQRRLTGSVTADLQGAVDQRGRAVQAFGASQLREGAAEFGGGDGSIERSIDLQKQYADALGRAAEKGPEAVAALEKLIDGIAKLEEQASHADFEAKNFGAAYSSNQSAAWDNYVASQPVAARAGLQAIGPIVNQPGFNPILAQHNPLSQSDTTEITRQATQLGLPNDLTGYALTIPRLEGATDHPELPLTRQFGLTGQYATQVNPNSRSSAIGAMLSALRDNYARTDSAPGAALAYNTGPDDPGLPAFIATGDTSHLASPTGARYAAGLGFASPQDRLAAGYADPAVNANIQATLARQRAGYGLSIADLQAGSYGRAAIEPQVLQDIASGRTGAQRVLEAGVNQNPGSPVGAAEATQRAAEAQRTLTEQITSSQAATRQQTQDSQQMASAILQGGDAAARATAAIAAHKEALATNSTVAEENKQAQLNLAAALAQEQQSAATAQHTVQQGTQRSQFLTGLPISDDYDRQYQIGQYDYEKQQQQANPLSYAANPTGFNAQADQNFAAIQSTNDVAQSASAATTAFDNMGKAIFSSFENASYSTERFKKTMGELLQSISQIILKLTVEQPLESLFTKTIGGWFGTSLNDVGNPNPAGGFLGALGLFGSSNGSSQNIVNPGLYSGIFDSSIGYGGVGGAAAAATGGAASDAEGGAISDLIFGAAAGGVWGPSGRINFHAAGGIFSGPTAFMDAGGGSNVAGEAGPEAAIPLTVLPDGSLGIKSGGGAGGPQILVHAPITYNAAGGGNGGGGVDQDNMKQIQKQFETMATEAVKNVLLRQQRPGGMLYNSYAGQSS